MLNEKSHLINIISIIYFVTALLEVTLNIHIFFFSFYSFTSGERR